MKLKAAFITLLFGLFFTVTSASAQVDRRIGTSQYKAPKRDKKEKVDFVVQTVAYLKKELTLDPFQEAAVKTIVENERGNIMAINEDKDSNIDIKKDKAREISLRIYKNIMPLLDKVQGAKYTELEEKKKY